MQDGTNPFEAALTEQRAKAAKRKRERQLFLILFGIIAIALLHLFFGTRAFSDTQIPGSDASDKLEAAGTVLRLIDTAVFKWGARIMAGVSIMSGAWALKEQRFGIAVICILGAMLFGTAPQWVRNIFAIAGSDSVFGAETVRGEGELARDGAAPEAKHDA